MTLIHKEKPTRKNFYTVPPGSLMQPDNKPRIKTQKNPQGPQSSSCLLQIDAYNAQGAPWYILAIWRVLSTIALISRDRGRAFDVPAVGDGADTTTELRIVEDCGAVVG